MQSVTSPSSAQIQRTVAINLMLVLIEPINQWVIKMVLRIVERWNFMRLQVKRRNTFLFFTMFILAGAETVTNVHNYVENIRNK